MSLSHHPGCGYQSSHLQSLARGEQRERLQEALDALALVDVVVAIHRDSDGPTTNHQKAVDEIDAVSRLANEFARRDVVDRHRALARDRKATEPHAIAKEAILLLGRHC